MKYQILAVGLKDDLLSHCREHFLERNIEMKNVLNISEAVSILENEIVHLLVLDMGYLRGIDQSNRIIQIRYVCFTPIVILSDIPEVDVAPTISAGADVCYDSRLPPSVITLLLSAQLRRYTEYNHFLKPETAPFQVGDIAIDPARRQVWVQGKLVSLLPREFSLLLYFMRNPGIVLTHEQICEHAWKKPDTVLPLSTAPSRFKRSKPVAVIFPDGRRLEVTKWKAAVTAIFQECATTTP